ncbi:MAG: polysaccharide lyase 6 family protein [Verrucomicrobiota bacterium]
MKLVPLSLFAAAGFSMQAALPPALQPEALRQLRPGNVLEVAEGPVETTGPILIQDLQGTEESPIIIRAAQRGRVKITGRAGFSLKNCAHVVLEGFVFENDANQQAVLLTDCHHVRITRCRFRLDESLKARWSQFWVYILGSKSGHNRVDHNLFEHQTQRGSMVFTRGDDATLTPSQHDRIDHNHFRDVVYASDSNGHETLRTGSNDMGASGKSTFTVIEDNLLERCSGEQEIVSLKSSENIVRNNTFIDCRGSICLRLGNRSEVSENVMLNPAGVIGVGGVKIYGFEHRVSGNHFDGLTGTGHEAPLALIPGLMDTESTDQIGKAYKDLTTAPATRVSITQNVWINCSPLIFGQSKPDKERPLTPNKVLFKDNIVAHTRPLTTPLIQAGLTRDLQTQDNVAVHHTKNTSNEPWAPWFHWHSEMPKGISAMPKRLTPADVGPDAP